MASVGVNPPKTPVTKGSNGIAAATVPNVCKMPGPPAPFVPTPLPNIGKSSDSPKGYSKKVKIEKKTVAIKGATFKSKGDVASKGTGGGLVSSVARDTAIMLCATWSLTATAISGPSPSALQKPVSRRRQSKRSTVATWREARRTAWMNNRLPAFAWESAGIRLGQCN